MRMGVDVSDLIKVYPQYRLDPFAAILSEILRHFETLENLRDRTVLEMGPGHRVGLMRFLARETNIKSIRGVGRSVIWPWIRHRAFIRAHVANRRLLDFFSEPQAADVYDLIYSRQVMEQHSIDPWILLASQAYRQQFKKRRFTDFDASYPASVPNLQAIFRRAWTALRPGGVIISHIGKRKYSALERDFLDSLNPGHVQVKDLGRLSRLVVLTKAQTNV